MRKISFIVFLFFCCLQGLFAQQNTLTVDSVYEDTQDMEARANFKLDAEGNPLALVKVVLPLPDVQIDKEGNSGICEVVSKTGEIWSWITATEDYGATEITIQHANYYPVTIKFADYGIVPKGKTVYRVLVTIPSALFDDASRLYTSMKFEKADSVYRLVLTDPACSASEKNLARKRLQELPEIESVNRAARMYALQYIKLSKQKEGVNKNVLINKLDSAIYWYGRLSNLAAVPNAKKIYEKFVENKSKIQGTKIFAGQLFLYEKGSGAILVKKRSQVLSGVMLKVYQDDKLTKAIPFETDAWGKFHVDIPGVDRCEASFEYLDGKTRYASERLTITSSDKNLNVKLYKQ